MSENKTSSGINEGASTSKSSLETVNEGASTSKISSINTATEECCVCQKSIDDNKEASVQCYLCDTWSHVKCTMDKQVFDLLEKICQQDSAKTKKALIYSGNVEYICQTCANRKITSKDSTENSSSKLKTQPSIASFVDASPQNIPINPPYHHSITNSDTIQNSTGHQGS